SYEVEVRWTARSAPPGRASSTNINAAADQIRFASRIPELLRADDTTISLALQLPDECLHRLRLQFGVAVQIKDVFTAPLQRCFRTYVHGRESAICLNLD